MHNAVFDFDAPSMQPVPPPADTASQLSSKIQTPLVSSGKMAADIVSIFEHEYRALRPRAPMPPFHIRFRRFVSLNTTIRLREGQLHVSLSDLLEGAPESVLHAIAHILIAKIYKKPIDRAHNHRYKRFQYSEAVARQTEQIRHARGAKRYSGPEGRYYNLEEVFDTLNAQFFHSLLGRPQLTWSEHHAKRLLGHYDAAHNTIVVSRVFDRPSSPRYAIEYLLYHEMLHLKHPVSVRGTRRCVHGAAFKADEKLFPQLDAALKFLKRL
ncbi:MAG TPA: M48 family peptidase [Acidobacteriaceae bacterium]|nr:M48 family peptidase [Acidobacteriaceae bacterium]